VFDTEVLRRAGVSVRELFARVRQNQLHAKVTEQMTQQAMKVSTQDIADYYRRHKSDLIVPDRRAIRIVITRTRARAQAARTALESGRTWKSVAKEYSLHFSRNQGGRITAEWKREDQAGLGATIFRARRGELVGPVKEDHTWAVFVVDKVKPTYQPTLQQARDEITERLQSAREDRALDAYSKKYRDKTSCAPGFKVPSCRNGPNPSDSDDQPSA
jgi:foldase protein PrsA